MALMSNAHARGLDYRHAVVAGAVMRVRADWTIYMYVDYRCIK